MIYCEKCGTVIFKDGESNDFVYYHCPGCQQKFRQGIEDYEIKPYG